MGKTDILAREYFSDKRRFADAFNYLLYDGRAAIAPGDLSPLDSVGVVTSSEARGRAKPTQKVRDTLKSWQAMEGDGAAYAILALEEQTNVHRGMSARCMLYDAMTYDAQLKAIAKKNRACDAQGCREGTSWLEFCQKTPSRPLSRSCSTLTRVTGTRQRACTG